MSIKERDIELLSNHGENVHRSIKPRLNDFI